MRWVPIHSELVRLGFMQHVDTLRQEGKQRLFECFDWDQKKGYQPQASKWFARWKKGVGLQRTFHELRNTWETGLRDARVNETEAAELAGHSKGTTLSYGHYAAPGHLANLRETINKLPANPGRQA